MAIVMIIAIMRNVRGSYSLCRIRKGEEKEEKKKNNKFSVYQNATLYTETDRKRPDENIVSTTSWRAAETTETRKKKVFKFNALINY